MCKLHMVFIMEFDYVITWIYGISWETSMLPGTYKLS
jgi:hypothetical protein